MFFTRPLRVPGRHYGLVKEWPFGSLSDSLTRVPLIVAGARTRVRA